MKTVKVKIHEVKPAPAEKSAGVSYGHGRVARAAKSWAAKIPNPAKINFSWLQKTRPITMPKPEIPAQSAAATAPNQEKAQRPLSSNLIMPETIGTWPVKNSGPAKAPKAPRKKPEKFYFLRLPVKDQIMFAKRMAILIKSGVPILQGLSMLKRQSSTRQNTHILGHLHAEVENGQFLSSGMGRFRKIFGDFAINIVRVGEVSGTLSENLNYLAEDLKKKQELRRKIVGALIYPVFIIFATVGIVILLTAYVFPKIMPIFQSFKFELPWTTRTLIFISNAFTNYGLWILLSCLLAVAFVFFLLRQPRVRLWAHRNVFRIPLLGPLLRDYHIANFSRTLGLLIKSDVRIVEALDIVASTMGNLAYKNEFVDMGRKITRGQKISTHMELDPKLFPPLFAQMVEVGETTGSLSSSLMYLAEMFEDDMNDATKNLTTSIEPVLMIFMGLLVGFIALSIITPIYGVTQNIHP